MLVKCGQVLQERRLYDAKMFLEAFKLGGASYRTTVISIRRVFNDYKSDKIPRIIQEVYKDTMSVEIAAMAIEQAYGTGGKMLK